MNRRNEMHFYQAIKIFLKLKKKKIFLKLINYKLRIFLYAIWLLDFMFNF
jgi:hypothetical protein